jgi:hypothetical protein
MKKQLNKMVIIGGSILLEEVMINRRGIGWETLGR